MTAPPRIAGSVLDVLYDPHEVYRRMSDEYAARLDEQIGGLPMITTSKPALALPADVGETPEWWLALHERRSRLVLQQMCGGSYVDPCDCCDVPNLPDLHVAVDVDALVAEIERLRTDLNAVRSLAEKRGEDPIEDDPVWPWELLAILDGQ